MSLEEESPTHGTTAELRALAHPLRLRILSLLTRADLTAAEVARKLGTTHANASYHLRQLLRIGTIAIAREERIHGGQAKRYRYDVARDPDDTDPDPTTDDARLIYTAMIAELQRRSALLRPSADNYLADAELWLEPRHWDAIRAQIADATNEIRQLAADPSTEDAIRVSATVALFRMGPDPATLRVPR